MVQTDIIIIGAGPGGYETAIEAARRGLKVTLMERDKVGGTCLNVGCIPTKSLAHSAEVLQEAKAAAALGITGIAPSAVSIDLAAAVARKDSVVARLTAGVDALLRVPNITLVKGEATFTGAHTVVAAGEEYTAPSIIIATGSTAARLPIDGADAPCVVTSTELLAQTTLPRRLCVIGGGVVGLEFASIFNTFGSTVTVVEYCKEVLPNMDKDMAKRLRLSLRKQGIAFQTGCAVERIEQKADGTASVSFKGKNETLESIEADLVLMSVGRRPNVEGLNAEQAGVEITRRGITVDAATMQTNVAGVYAIGDANGLCPLAHAAIAQGRRAINHITGRGDDRLNLNRIPAAVFTSPQLAAIGKREEDYDKDAAPAVYKAFYRANGRALTMEAEEGYLKILANAETGRIEGVHILGSSAAELLHEAAAVMAYDGTVQQLRDIVHAHPTLSELYFTAVATAE